MSVRSDKINQAASLIEQYGREAFFDRQKEGGRMHCETCHSECGAIELVHGRCLVCLVHYLNIIIARRAELVAACEAVAADRASKALPAHVQMAINAALAKARPPTPPPDPR